MTMLRSLWHRWKRFGLWLGDQIARVFLVVFYFTVALPFGLLVRATQDPLERRPGQPGGWLSRSPAERDLTRAARQF